MIYLSNFYLNAAMQYRGLLLIFMKQKTIIDPHHALFFPIQLQSTMGVVTEIDCAYVNPHMRSVGLSSALFMPSVERLASNEVRPVQYK